MPPVPDGLRFPPARGGHPDDRGSSRRFGARRPARAGPGAAAVVLDTPTMGDLAMKHLSLPGLFAAAVLALTPPATSLAADCRQMRAAEPADAIWTCRVSCTLGAADVTANRCFLSSDAGFRWMQRESGRATGHIRQGNCDNGCRTMRDRDRVRQQG